jgi:hypothetical protein
MSRGPRWIALGVLLGLVGVAIAIYFAWGAKLEAEYERRVQALRERGEYIDKPRSWSARVPADENAAVPLTEGAEVLARLQEEDEGLEGLLAVFTLWGWDSEYHDPEDYERLRRAWSKLDAYFAKVEDAGTRTVFAPPPIEPSLEVAPWSGIQEVTWRADDSVQVAVTSTVRCRGLEILRIGLEDGSLDARVLRERWDRQLAAVEPVAAMREVLRHRRMEQIRYTDMLRRGEDPWAEIREVWPDLEKTGVLPERPWYASWYGRPILHQRALDVLDEAAFAIQHATSEASLRALLAEEHSSGTELGTHDFGVYARTLEHLAVLRLARITMVLQEDAKVYGGPRKTLSEYAAAFGGALPHDPFTGKPFRYERDEDRVVLSCSVAVPGEGEWESLRSALFERLFFEELLVWDVRWAPAKKGD